MKHALLCLFPLLLSAVHLPAQQKPQVHLISVEKDVKIEALDWGGTGRPLLFIAGAGNDAHIFDTFAPKFVPRFHVYGVTRRGFGASSHPAYITSNYTAERLGSDVLAVMSALKIDHPVLIGHSLAGEEMSWIGNHHPEAVAGLVYLEAGYSFALYSPALGDKVLDALTLRQELDTFLAAHTPPGPAMAQLQAGPVLAIFADPHDPGPIFANDAKGRAAYVANDEVETTKIVEAFQSAVPQAHVVRIANASHYIFISNEAQVITEINNFLGSLKQ
jgi:non-heme chloroperoxidase